DDDDDDDYTDDVYDDNDDDDEDVGYNVGYNDNKNNDRGEKHNDFPQPTSPPTLPHFSFLFPLPSLFRHLKQHRGDVRKYMELHRPGSHHGVGGTVASVSASSSPATGALPAAGPVPAPPQQRDFSLLGALQVGRVMVGRDSNLRQKGLMQNQNGSSKHGDVGSESALRCAGTLLSLIRAVPPSPGPDGEPKSLRSPCC
ncbi:hypothetical protein PoB_002232900, partial [Plakobranchus ocellatus]